MNQALDFHSNRRITLSQFRDVLVRSSLGERRPINEPSTLQGMLDHANLLISCWDGERLVGIARSVTDFHYCCYLSDLAVDRSYQKQGIGRRLMHETAKCLGKSCTIILLSAPAAVDYYPHIGLEKHPQAWILRPSS